MRVSWHHRNNAPKIGIGDTGNGWCVVDKDEKVLFSLSGYSKGNRLKIEGFVADVEEVSKLHD